nr:immunoglobulin light chain junction region [Macaca mulatta]
DYYCLICHNNVWVF